MESVNEIMDQIKKETEPVGNAVMYLCCPLCGTLSLLDLKNPIPGSCYACQKPTAFGTGPTPTAAKEMAAKEKAAAMAAKVPVQPPTQATTAPQPMANDNSNAASEPTTKTKSRQAKPRQEAKPEPASAAPVAPVLVNQPVTDFRQARMLAVANFITAKQLNQVDTKVVGRASVYAIGFTQWVTADDGRQVPAYTMCDPADDPSIYQAAKQKAREFDGKVMNDVALLTNLPDDLLPLLFNAELYATTNSKHGRVSCKPENVVEIGARLSGSGSIIWSVVRKVS
jgi:hypothetical protein